MRFARLFLFFSFLTNALGAAELCTEQNLLAGLRPQGARFLFHPENFTDGKKIPEGSVWNAKEATIFQVADEPVTFDLGEAKKVSGFWLQADNNEVFSLSTSEDGQNFSELSQIPAANQGGQRGRGVSFPPRAARYLRLRAIQHDGYVTLTEVVAFCKPPKTMAEEIPSSGQWGYTQEKRKGLGETTPFLVYLLFFLGLGVWLWKKGERPDLKKEWFSLDKRSLGLFRVVLALVLIYDLLSRLPYFKLFYSQEGWIPASRLLFSPSPWFPFALLHGLDTDTSIQLLFAFGLLSYLSLLIGFLTPVAHFLSAACLILIHTKVWALNHGGHMTLRLLTLWSLCLPLGARFSVDALAQREKETEENFRSPLVFGILLQLSAIYFFNVLSKYAQEWRNGDFALTVLQVSPMTTPFGNWLFGHMPEWLGKVSTWGTLWVEALAPFLLLFPFRTTLLRSWMVPLLVGFHIALGLLLYVRDFSLAMTAFLFLFLPWSSAAAVLTGVKSRMGRTTLFYPRVLNIGLWRLHKGLGILVCGLALVWLSQLVRDNYPLNAWLSYSTPKLFFSVAQMTQTHQRWCMFGSCSQISIPQKDENIIAIATLPDGKQFDPLCEAMTGEFCPVSNGIELPLKSVPRESWNNYIRNLTRYDNAYRESLKAWLEKRREESRADGPGDFTYQVWRWEQPITKTATPNENPLMRFLLLREEKLKD